MNSRISQALVVCGLVVALLGGAATSPASGRRGSLPPPSLRPSAAWLSVTTGSSNIQNLAPSVWAITARSNLAALAPFDNFENLRHLSRNAVFTHGAAVELAASSVRGSRFAGWSGDCTGTGTCSVQLTENRNVTADFEPLCVVPRLKGKTVPQARAALSRAHCKLGTVRHAYVARVKRGRVAAQNPAPATVRPRGAKVRITLSRGRRH